MKTIDKWLMFFVVISAILVIMQYFLTPEINYFYSVGIGFITATLAIIK